MGSFNVACSISSISIGYGTKVAFVTGDGRHQDEDVNYLPDEVKAWAGLDSNNPQVYNPYLKISEEERFDSHKTHSVATLNDRGDTFKTIANAIEKSL